MTTSAQAMSVPYAWKRNLLHNYASGLYFYQNNIKVYLIQIYYYFDVETWGYWLLKFKFYYVMNQLLKKAKTTPVILLNLYMHLLKSKINKTCLCIP